MKFDVDLTLALIELSIISLVPTILISADQG